MTLTLLSLSIILPILIGAIKGFRNKLEPYNYIPLYICLVLGLFPELAWQFPQKYLNANIVTNVYLLLEFILISWQLYRWKTNDIPGWNFFLFGAVPAFWLFDVIFLESITLRIGWFRLVYSYCLLIWLFDLLNRLIITKGLRTNLFQSIVTLTLLTFYTYNILVELFCFYYSLFSREFILHVFMIKSIINALSMIALSIAILCIPRKLQFSYSFV